MVAMELSEELDLLGHENQVVALGLAHDGGQDPALPPLVARSGVGVDVLLLDAVRLRRWLRRNQVDIVLAHGGWAVQVVALAVPRGGPQLVWQRILGFPSGVFRLPRRWWWRLMIGRLDAAVALTPPLEEEMRRLGFEGPVWVIPNARRPERFMALDRAEERARLCAEIDVDPGVDLLGFVGHFVRQKRPERAVEVLSRVRSLGRPAHLVMAGGGTLMDEVRAEAKTRGVEEHVTFLGHRNDVEHVFAGVDVVVLTSDDEGIPGVAIEAHMAGAPVVTFPVGGVAGVVTDGVTGAVLDDHDPATMADTVDRLLGDPDRLAHMSEAARARAADFATSIVAQTYAARLASLPDRN